jgi:hypothetical protein
MTLIPAGECPPYASFYNPELEAKVRRIYRADYRFLDRSLWRGCLGPELHSRLSAL